MSAQVKIAVWTNWGQR